MGPLSIYSLCKHNSEALAPGLHTLSPARSWFALTGIRRPSPLTVICNLTYARHPRCDVSSVAFRPKKSHI